MLLGFLLRKQKLSGIHKVITVLIWLLLFLLGIDVGGNQKKMCIRDSYCKLTDYNKAIEMNEKAISIFKSIGDSISIALCYNDRGIIHIP